MNLFKHIAIIAMAFAIGIPALAVTDREMDEARTIATKAYLRYANDGSGYLDEIKVTTMADLTKKLKDKEKENLKAFNAVKIPSDYASWDKQKLVEFWSVTAFSTPGLTEKGKVGKSRARKQISAMNISAPKPAETPAQETATPEAAAADMPEAAQPAAPEPIDTAGAQQDILADQNAIQQDMENAATPSLEKGESHTWVYILILAILIGIVIWLVAFAAKVMKKQNGDTTASETDSDDVRERARQALAAKKEELAAKDEDIRRLNQRLHDEQERCIESSRIAERLKVDNQRLNEQIERLRIDNNKLADQVADLKARMQAGADTPAPRANSARATQPAKNDLPPVTPETRKPEPKEEKQPEILKVIYLGRANSRGIFVRADRRVSIGNTIYRLDTEDGMVGTFHVVNMPAVTRMALDRPAELLAGGCTADDITDTLGATGIVTESSGTAIFENGYWKVLRKSRIRYE